MEFDIERLRESEAREWDRRFKAKVREIGRNEAVLWWTKTISDIERIRGRVMKDDLLSRIRKIQDESKKN